MTTPQVSVLVQGERRVRVEYQLPGSVLAETGNQVLDAYDPMEAREKIPENAFVFQLYEVEEALVTIDGQSQVVCGQRRRESPLYFVGGDVFGETQVLTMIGMGQDLRILLDNMRANGWHQVCRTRHGVYVPFPEGSMLLPVTENTSRIR